MSIRDSHRAVYDMVRDGKVGKVNIIKISSRDPEPPPVSYVKVSGGIFYDMTVSYTHLSQLTRMTATGQPPAASCAPACSSAVSG